MSNIYVYSKGEFNQLDINFLNNKAIIRIHNIKEQGWINNPSIKNLLNLYFDDIRMNQLLWYEKFCYFLPLFIQKKIMLKFIKKEQALTLLSFIEDNKNSDFIIHCEFGKSRSVAVAKFIEDFYNGNLKNKTVEECKNYNTLVYDLLKNKASIKLFTMIKKICNIQKRFFYVETIYKRKHFS